MLTDIRDFGINEKTGRHPIIWFQTNTLWGVHFKFRGGVVTANSLGRRLTIKAQEDES